MTAALARGSCLGPKTSVTDWIETLGEITKATDNYVELHKGIFHSPFSGDGKFRQDTAIKFSEFSKKIGQKTEELSAYLPDKTMPISENIKRREAGISSLNQKIDAMQGLIIQNDNPVPQPVADGQAGLVM